MQWHRSATHVIGVQEARTTAGTYQSEHYWIFASGAHIDHGPHYGCELWIHKTLPFMDSSVNAQDTLGRAQFAIQHADPRRLFVHAKLAT